MRNSHERGFTPAKLSNADTSNHNQTSLSCAVMTRRWRQKILSRLWSNHADFCLWKQQDCNHLFASVAATACDKTGEVTLRERPHSHTSDLWVGCHRPPGRCGGTGSWAESQVWRLSRFRGSESGMRLRQRQVEKERETHKTITLIIMQGWGRERHLCHIRVSHKQHSYVLIDSDFSPKLCHF